ncbi:peptide deformylase [Saprospira sp. CCB-QB6]|uniref:peptide deformylase n=1 Tax=Saprospira sp. CCB-QB6 TaxID=3023936 RepID=UPI0023494553|nr:peptide deformylase [Saprospira sp. CCB-QB6]WCL82254.1 peptide deformylase [Saprospira sp. CCB-QB6]
MKLAIYAYGHPVLRKECEEIENNSKGLEELIENMWETMYHAGGMGIAAPQVGQSLRLFLVDTLQLDEEKNGEKGLKEVFINPIIIEEAGKPWTYEEGCLSIPDIHGKVKRKAQVRIEYYDQNFELKEKVFDGLNARVIQHEYDHIEGVLFTDYLTPLKKRMLKKRLDKIQTGDIPRRYKMVFARR